MLLRPFAVLLALSGAVPALTLPEISSRLLQAPFPDTADYWVVTTMEMMGQRFETRAHVIQAGPLLQWMEIPTGPRKMRMVRNGERMRVTDLATGTGQTMAAPKDDLAFVRSPLAGGSWLEPVAKGAGLWSLRDTTHLAGRRFQELLYSESQNRVVGMTRIGYGGDTVRTTLNWGLVKGKPVLNGMDLETHIQGKVSRVTIQYTDWLFPRSIPAQLFQVP